MDRERAAQSIEAFLRALGHDPDRDAQLRGTGARVASLWADDLLDGYAVDPDAIFAEAMEASRGQPIVVVKGLATHVVCPHHLTIGAGHADVAYLPRDRVLGLGDVARAVDAICHRLVLQEDATRAVAHAFVDRLDARGAACAMRLRHGCLVHHGAKKRGSSVTTIALAGTCEDGDDRALALAALAMEGPRAPRAVARRKKRAP
jgi:GTP cyclohydrolase I